MEIIKVKNKVGKPLKFRSAAQLQLHIDDYFKQTPNDEQTITGLALHLNLTRTSLMEYEGRNEYANTVKRAKQMIELAYEKRLVKRGNSGDIFALKNFGWKDTQTVETTNLTLNAHYDIKTAEDFTRFLKEQTKDTPDVA